MSASWLSPSTKADVSHAVAPVLSLLGLVGGVFYAIGACREQASPGLLHLAAISNLLAAYLVNKPPSRTDQLSQASRSPKAPYGLLASFCTAISWGCHLLVRNAGVS
jgi:hypothetical protein